MAEPFTINIDTLVQEDLPATRQLISDPERKGSGILLARSAKPLLYPTVVNELSGGTRNTPEQVGYLDAYERSVAVFRVTSAALRRHMDAHTLERRIHVQEHHGDPDPALKQRLQDAIMYSNRASLAFAGHVGLSLLGSEPADLPSDTWQWGAGNEANADPDALACILALDTPNDVQRSIAGLREAGLPITDDALKHAFEAAFTRWINQFRPGTFADITERFQLDGVRLQYGEYSMLGAAFRRKHSLVKVDERFMAARRSAIIGSEDFQDLLWQNFLKLGGYDHDRRENPYDPAFCVFTYGAPGSGKTFIAHAMIREFSELCSGSGVPLWALTHSTTDYASHYQNQTANQLSQLATQIGEFPGIVLMYVADADNIFLSRNDPRLTAEQRQTLNVYFKMFDGQLIPKNGKFMALMDANYVDGIDDATKSRLFDEIYEMPRFSMPEQFAAYVRAKLTKGLEGGILLQDEHWQEIGRYLLDTPLSNREIEHVVRRMRRQFTVPEEMFGASFDAHLQYRNDQLRGVTHETILDAYRQYLGTRAEIEVASARAKIDDRRVAFLKYLTETPNPQGSHEAR